MLTPFNVVLSFWEKAAAEKAQNRPALLPWFHAPHISPPWNEHVAAAGSPWVMRARFIYRGASAQPPWCHDKTDALEFKQIKVNGSTPTPIFRPVTRKYPF
jgi:hypothetical protein